MIYGNSDFMKTINDNILARVAIARRMLADIACDACRMPHCSEAEKTFEIPKPQELVDRIEVLAMAAGNSSEEEQEKDALNAIAEFQNKTITAVLAQVVEKEVE